MYLNYILTCPPPQLTTHGRLRAHTNNTTCSQPLHKRHLHLWTSGKSVQKMKRSGLLVDSGALTETSLCAALHKLTLVQEKHWREVFYWTILFLFFMIIMLFKCLKSCPLGAPTHSTNTYTGLDPTFTFILFVQEGICYSVTAMPQNCVGKPAAILSLLAPGSQTHGMRAILRSTSSCRLIQGRGITHYNIWSKNPISTLLLHILLFIICKTKQK